MNSASIKLILLEYRNFDYIPELKGTYIQNFKIENGIIIPFALCPRFLNINLFLLRYNLLNKCKTYNSLKFYMNLLNYSGFNNWKFTSDCNIINPNIKITGNDHFYDHVSEYNTNFILWNMYVEL